MLAVTDIRTPPECTAELSRLGFEVISLPPLPSLPAPVASHPDMLIFRAEHRLLTHRNYFKIASQQLESICHSAGLELVLIDEIASDSYPRDVLLNAAHVGNRIIASESAISTHIKNICIDEDIELINVKQGYAKCSVCIVGENAIITADHGIARAAIAAGIDVLTITPGHVELEGYDTGFIGGASGLVENTVYFCGDISAHPDYPAIKNFCAAHGKKIVCLGKIPLTDVGTIFFF